MIGLGAPFWLLLLSGLPLLRWLHRFQRQGRIQPTAALFLWRRIQTEGAAGNAPAKPDPRWRLRAAIAALLILALSDPYRETKSGIPIEVWLDDSLSQFTREEGGTRLQQGIDRLIQRVEKERPSTLILHSLGNPTATRIITPQSDRDWISKLEQWGSDPRGEPHPPAPALMHPDNRHILLTDGADIQLNHWLKSAPLSEIIQTGSSTGNLSLTRLAIRPSPGTPSATQGLVELWNSGESKMNARLILIQRGREIESWLVKLPPGERKLLEFATDLSYPADLIARLHATDDSLHLDNELRLPLSSALKPIAVKVVGECGRYLSAFLQSHPELEQSGRNPDIFIDCDNAHTSADTPLLRLHGNGGRQTIHSQGHWHVKDGVQHLSIQRGLYFSLKEGEATSSGVTLLSADGHTLIRQTRTPAQTIDVYLDLQQPGFAHSPEYPLLLSALIERLLQRPLAESLVSASRNPDASRITPLSLPETSNRPATDLSKQQASITSLPIIAALVLLLIDMVWGFRPQRRSGG
ncbi:MAG: hypothetical protein JMN27_13300 [gamma proteobacterium endosymbiont of Lamellibrachia anaximandri]|nr:hypothetical protein [gamma proteobacterium endosymbiont of Lamellibrachia anaximandri]MBL3534790.1 hypothetical protein [gamma proteobacterium endosymbiont of Lamellibrachia anaximandri]